jgi:hypothetical protein
MTLKALARRIRDKLLWWKMPSVQLVRGRVGELYRSIHAEITDDGDLHVTGQDFGPGASMTGADEEEFIAAVDKQDKDRLLLALLERLYGGNTRAVYDFARFASSKGIKVTRFHWP